MIVEILKEGLKQSLKPVGHLVGPGVPVVDLDVKQEL